MTDDMVAQVSYDLNWVRRRLICTCCVDNDIHVIAPHDSQADSGRSLGDSDGTVAVRLPHSSVRRLTVSRSGAGGRQYPPGATFRLLIGPSQGAPTNEEMGGRPLLLFFLSSRKEKKISFLILAWLVFINPEV